MIADNLKSSLERDAKSEQNALVVACVMEIILNSLEQQRKSRRKKVVRVSWACYIITGLIIFFCEFFTISQTARSGDEIFRFRCKAGQMLEKELSQHKFPNESNVETTVKILQSGEIEPLKEIFYQSL